MILYLFFFLRQMNFEGKERKIETVRKRKWERERERKIERERERERER